MSDRTVLSALQRSGRAVEAFSHESLGVINITATLAALRERQAIDPSLREPSVALYQESTYTFLKKFRDWCPERVMEIRRNAIDLFDPVLLVDLRNGEHCQIDGTHRLIALWDTYEDQKIPLDDRIYMFHAVYLEQLIMGTPAGGVDMSWGRFDMVNGKRVDRENG